MEYPPGMGLPSFIRTIILGSQIRRSFALVACSTVASVVLTLISYPIYLRYLGYEQYGRWLVLSTVLSVAQLGTLGLAPAVTKYVAEDHARRNMVAIETCMATALAAVAIPSIGIVLLIACGRETIVVLLGIADVGRQEAIDLLIPIGALSGYSLLVQIPSATLAGLGRMDQTSLIQLLARIAGLGVSWLMLAAKWGLLAMLYGNLATLVLTHIATNVLIRRGAPIRTFALQLARRVALARLLRFGIGMVASSLLQMLLLPLNRLLLFRFAGAAAVPTFEIAYSGSMQIRALAANALQVLVPEFSRANALQDARRQRSLLNRSNRLTAFVGLVQFGCLALCASPALKLWLGLKFRPDLVSCFQIALFGAFASLLGVPSYCYLLALARVTAVTVSQAIQGLINLAVASGVVFMTGSISPFLLSFAVAIGFALSTLWLMLCARFLQMAAETISECSANRKQNQPDSSEVDPEIWTR